MAECLPLLVGIESESLSSPERELFSRLQPAGYILFSRNIADADSCRDLCEELQSISTLPHPPIIAIDQEGGRVIRTKALGIELPSAANLAQSSSSQVIVDAAHLCAKALLSLGLNTNFAPVLDAQSSQSNALQDRCWGHDYQQITSLAGMWNAELQLSGIQSCAKHFPGMGAANCDPHFELPVLHGNQEHCLQSSLLPFMALMPELPSIMVAHLLMQDIDADLPSSLSPKIVEGFLRRQLGYEGLIFTDDLCMGAISKLYSPAQSIPMALQAGCDVPLLCHDVLDHLEDVAQAIASVPAARLKSARARIAQFCKALHPRPAMPYIEWQELLQDCQKLTTTCTQAPSHESDFSSPVQNY